MSLKNSESHTQNNPLGTEGGEKLAEILRVSKTLTHLDVSHCGVMAEPFRISMRSNSNLLSLEGGSDANFGPNSDIQGMVKINNILHTVKENKQDAFIIQQNLDHQSPVSGPFYPL